MIILASKSPRRRELLSLLTDDFEIMSADVDESLDEGISPEEAVMHLSKIKAEPFKQSGKIVIGADTVVAVGKKILGKPENNGHAFEMLKSLSGKIHSVFTGVTILNGEKSKTFFCKTDVEFYNLTDEEISSYIATGECFDKAGAYGIQGRGALLVKGINGDYFNVVGLPVSMLNREIKNF